MDDYLSKDEDEEEILEPQSPLLSDKEKEKNTL